MVFVQLIYASRIQQDRFPKDGAQQILETSLSYNRKHSITGVLFCDGNYFLQAIEGSRDNVSDLYNRIAADPRHSRVTLLSLVDIAVRDFGDWSMELLTYKSETVKMVRRFTVGQDFDPFLLSSEGGRQLLLYLAEQHLNATVKGKTSAA